MTIGEILRYKDKDTYNKIMNSYRAKPDKPKKKIKLGDNVESLMKADSYARSGRRVKQRGWG